MNSGATAAIVRAAPVWLRALPNEARPPRPSSSPCGNGVAFCGRGLAGSHHRWVLRHRRDDDRPRQLLLRRLQRDRGPWNGSERWRRPQSGWRQWERVGFCTKTMDVQTSAPCGVFGWVGRVEVRCDGGPNARKPHLIPVCRISDIRTDPVIFDDRRWMAKFVRWSGPNI